jgi:3-oxoacyl-[acyl-carrier protein] reductase
MFGKLENKVAIITGAGQGIGAGIARVFAGAGAKVMVATRTASHGETTVADIEKAGGTAALCAVDIGNLENVERAVSETVDKWGGIDIMVHNAASFLGGPVEGYSEDVLGNRAARCNAGYFLLRGLERRYECVHQDCGNRAGARQHHRKRG